MRDGLCVCIWFLLVSVVLTWCLQHDMVAKQRAAAAASSGAYGAVGGAYGEGGGGGEGKKGEGDEEEEQAFVPPFEVPKGMETVRLVDYLLESAVEGGCFERVGSVSASRSRSTLM